MLFSSFTPRQRSQSLSAAMAAVCLLHCCRTVPDADLKGRPVTGKTQTQNKSKPHRVIKLLTVVLPTENKNQQQKMVIKIEQRSDQIWLTMTKLNSQGSWRRCTGTGFPVPPPPPSSWFAQLPCCYIPTRKQDE